MIDPVQPDSEAVSPAWSRQDLAGDPHETPDKAARVQQMFGAIAGRYDLNNRLHSFGRDQAWRRKAVALAGVQPGDDVLDVACGSGDLTMAFADAGAASVTGLDFTEEMLAIARQKAAAANGCAVMFQWADAMDLPFDDESFDIVSIAFGIRNVARPAQALAEFRRVLRRGGRLVILEFTKPKNPLIGGLNHLYTNRIMPFTATLIAGDRSGAYRYLPRSIETFADDQAMVSQMNDAGLTSVTLTPMTFGVCTAFVGRVDASDTV